MPRALVQVVTMFDVTPLTELSTGLVCDLMQRSVHTPQANVYIVTEFYVINMLTLFMSLMLMNIYITDSTHKMVWIAPWVSQMIL